MPNVVKYHVGAYTGPNVLIANNLVVGNNNGDYGTSFYTGITPGASGYTLYFDKASNGPSIYTPADDASLIAITNQMAGTGFTAVYQCLDHYFASSTGTCVNQDYSKEFPYVPINNLVLHLDATVPEGFPVVGPTWYDLAGRGTRNNGTITGAEYDNSVKAMKFAGGESISVASNPMLDSFTMGLIYDGNSLTLNVWFYYEGSSTDPKVLAWKDDYPTSANVGYKMYIDGSGTGFFEILTVNGRAVLQTNTTLITGQWYNLTGTYNGATVDLYLNGQPEANTSRDSKIVESGAYPLLIGNGMTGGIGLVQVYTACLTSAQVENQFNTYIGRFGAPPPPNP